MKHSVLVQMELTGVTATEFRDYVQEAVARYGGAFEPQDPFFGHDVEEVTVVTIKMPPPSPRYKTSRDQL